MNATRNWDDEIVDTDNEIDMPDTAYDERVRWHYPERHWGND